jgi:hypothetical protein
MAEMCRHGIPVDFNDMSVSVTSDVAYPSFVIVTGLEATRSICHTDNNGCYSESYCECLLHASLSFGLMFLIAERVAVSGFKEYAPASTLSLTSVVRTRAARRPDL